ncbi:MAG TPA: KUP/HAK/KT family potassium transporter, partial [Longimicrobiales bacterium]
VLMVPGWALLPVVALATTATVIASQALISGSYSLTMQAVQLGYSPRVDIQHTSALAKGQIYIPAINWILMVACIGLVLGFGSSSNLAAAYGVAVTTTMVVTSVLFYVVAREHWRWSLPVAIAVGGLFLAIDLAFWGANLLKIPHGGWFPLVVGVIVFTVLTTWKQGRAILAARMKTRTLPMDEFQRMLLDHPPTRVPGTAVFMTSTQGGTPPALLHNLKHNKVLHQRVVFLSVITDEVPYVDAGKRSEVQRMHDGVAVITLHYGFMEDADVPAALAAINDPAFRFAPMETSYFLGRETILATRRGKGMALWREKLFATMSNNARSAASFFRLPPNQVVELGAQVEL